ncbi:BgtE-5553 [Blumeria graminis f. sp. tritici]|uniref:BgtE-5553 n=1 Tax=Blumeria graminis f. sp. tritici TaxID=62690 RepID=A0A9X9QG68_BLUGR|nr:BgtE-5553 [Blumeria graminis f. sp. tritici]
MWIKFGVFLTIFGLIHLIKCIDIAYSDVYLPDGTNGFVCQLHFYPIDRVREEAKKVIELFFFGNYNRRFPASFEDTQLFNVKSDILLSWPIFPSGVPYSKNPGKIRLVINIRGQIMGVVTKKPKVPNQKTSFERCNPVRRFFERDTDDQATLNERLTATYSTFGYHCGSKFFPESVVKWIKGPELSIYFQQRLSGKYKLCNLEKFTGDEFRGADLYWYPVHHKISHRAATGPPGKFRAVFDMSNSEFKGIINIEDRKEKCAPVRDLSSTSSHEIYRPSSLSNFERIQDSYWPQTCLGHKFKSKTILLYLEFALKNWVNALNGRKPYFPLVEDLVINLWLIRTPENHDNSFRHAFAIGHNTGLDRYSLYHAEVQKGVIEKFHPCLEFSRDIIRGLQENLAWPPSSGESYSPVH